MLNHPSVIVAEVLRAIRLEDFRPGGAAPGEEWRAIRDFLNDFLKRTDGAELAGDDAGYVACPDSLRNRAIDLLKNFTSGSLT